ncbi:hypothetical protein FF3_00773 [Fretibacterium fastidiosum]|uniref:hypothetical protein n=2 Tax=Fretibacterium fastidiosum TaxID=651822 RepID=UPI0038FCA23E
MVRPSRLFGLLAAFAACGALCLGALAGPAAGLSDAEYREMMKDRNFARADGALNETWSRILKEGGLSKAGIKALKADQAEWVRKGRDTQARLIMENGYAALEAYTTATGMRTEALPDLTERIFLQDRPDGPQGYYVRREDGRETGWLSVRWIDKEAGEVRVGAEAIVVLRPDNVRSGAWSGEGAVRKGVLKALDGEESATFTFKGDKVQVVASPGFSSSTVGLGVTIEGTYVRQRLPKP